DCGAYAVRSRSASGSAVEGLSFLVRCDLFYVQTGIVRPGWNIKQTGLRAIGWVIPVRAPLVARKNQSSLRCRDHAGNSLRPAFAIETGCPVHLNERFAKQELARRAIEHIEEAVSVRPHHDFSRRALPGHIGK